MRDKLSDSSKIGLCPDLTTNIADQLASSEPLGGDAPTGRTQWLPDESDRFRQIFGPDTVAEFVPPFDPRVTLEFRRKFDILGREVPLVECGPKSKNLCVLILRDEQARDTFLESNPDLVHTLITREGHLETSTEPDKHYIWIRISGWRPTNMEVPGVRWVSSGVLLLVNVPSKIPLPAPSIIETTFEAVHWPEEFKRTARDNRIITECGPFFFLSGQNKLTLNLAAHSRLISMEMGIQFHAEENAFYWKLPGQKVHAPVSTGELTAAVTKYLNVSAVMSPGWFPMDELRLVRIRALVEHLKLMTALTTRSAHESLFQYVRARLSLRAGGSVTVEEIYADYLEYSRKHELSVFPRSKFHVELPKVMLKAFNVSRANNIQRMSAGCTKSTARRGFRGLVFEAVAGDAVDGMQSSDEMTEPDNTPAEVPSIVFSRQVREPPFGSSEHT